MFTLSFSFLNCFMNKKLKGNLPLFSKKIISLTNLLKCVFLKKANMYYWRQWENLISYCHIGLQIVKEIYTLNNRCQKCHLFSTVLWATPHFFIFSFQSALLSRFHSFAEQATLWKCAYEKSLDYILLVMAWKKEKTPHDTESLYFLLQPGEFPGRPVILNLCCVIVEF